MWVWWGSRLTPINFAIGVTSLAIQAGILVPWHDIISEDLRKVQQEQRKLEASQLEVVKKVDLLLQKYG